MQKTDWDAYYKRPYKTALFTRRITGNLLVKYIQKHLNSEKISIMEIGGANSCFHDLIQQKINPYKYIIMDNNQYGLDKFAEKISKNKINKQTILIYNNVLLPIETEKTDIVFSVGLVEHFSEEETKTAILNHFHYVKDNGIVIIGFPTPTFLYKTIRTCAEILNMWIFHDERPITLGEAHNILKNNAIILDQKIAWSIGLTQAFLVLKKRTRENI